MAPVEKPETVHFVEWHSAAPIAERAFAAWRAMLEPILPPASEIEHIGATAVPGCMTKGDVDIVVRVNASDFADADAALAAKLARNTGSIRTEQFAAFEKREAEPPLLGVQLVVRGSTFDDFAMFRDRLLSDPQLLAAYNALKREHQGKSMDAYRAAKAAFIEGALDDRDRVA